MTTATYDEIKTAKLVEIRWDFFYVKEDACDWFPNRKIFQVLDDEELAELTARDPTTAKESVADGNPWQTQPLDYQLVTYITRDFLVHMHKVLNEGREYSKYNEGIVRVREMNVIA